MPMHETSDSSFSQTHTTLASDALLLKNKKKSVTKCYPVKIEPRTQDLEPRIPSLTLTFLS